MGCGYLNLYPMIASEKMAMGFHSFYPHGIGSTDLSQSHQPHSHHNIVSLSSKLIKTTFQLITLKKWNELQKYEIFNDSIDKLYQHSIRNNF